jgi:hypothetical protein
VLRSFRRLHPVYRPCCFPPITHHLLRVTCLRCGRIVQIQKADAVRRGRDLERCRPATAGRHLHAASGTPRRKRVLAVIQHVLIDTDWPHAMALKHHSTPLSGGDREVPKKALGTPPPRSLPCKSRARKNLQQTGRSQKTCSGLLFESRERAAGRKRLRALSEAVIPQSACCVHFGTVSSDCRNYSLR